MKKEELRDFVLRSSGNEKNIVQICMNRNGKRVYEESFRGFKNEDCAHVMSVTKGVMSLLVGIAMDKGLIKDVDQPVLDFFPDYQVKKGEKTIYDVKLHHLLTMTAPYKYRSEPWTKVCTSNDWTLAALDLLGGRKGITGEFKYATLGIQILAGIIEHACKEKCLDFANRNLFVPLGIKKRKIHGDSSKEDQLDYVMNKKPRENEWYSDPQDTVVAGWGLCLSARDLSLIGDMILHDGVYDGKKIVSKEYLEKMLTPHLKLDERFGYMNYGYLWYKPYDDKEVYAAIGDGGNVIYVNKEKGVSVGVTGTFKPAIYDRVEFIENHVLPICLADIDT